ncbi:tyrosine-type recombinase/integrase [Micromonospora humida]|uniref:tyrosine-type recombinase/integrase n=1 Tax=Micromonospora humida TaxID=2809018 RepID=UPI003672CB17
MGQVHKLRTSYPTPTFAHAVQTFLVAHTANGAWSSGSTVKYRQTLTALAGTPVSDNVAALDTGPGAAALARAYPAAFGTTVPATRVRHLSTLRSALAWWREPAGWIARDPTAGWVRPKVTVDTTPALTRDQVAALWRLDVGLRDKTLWRLLYETVARAEETLTLDVSDLGLASKRARVVFKRQDRVGVLADRRRHDAAPATRRPHPRPGVLADRKPTRAVATVDLCSVTGRARPSYRRAAEIFEYATHPLADPVDRARGFTLHQLRHVMLTHEAENGTNTASLLARSRHASVRCLERYARPGPEAVAAHAAAPAARRRTGQGR